ncbi:hypothetical protein [Streptomyces achromogenes]|uniref:hypothetical protein n=1 Tax=Streptomyces achromogenes TaxID=67255 RepID=UPI003700D325
MASALFRPRPAKQSLITARGPGLAARRQISRNASPRLASSWPGASDGGGSPRRWTALRIDTNSA